MEWNHLRNKCCPKCIAPIESKLLDGMVKCVNPDCSFQISFKKFDEIMNRIFTGKKSKRRIQKIEDDDDGLPPRDTMNSPYKDN